MVYIKFNAISRFCYLAVAGIEPLSVDVTNGFSAKAMWMYVSPDVFVPPLFDLNLKPLDNRSKFKPTPSASERFANKQLVATLRGFLLLSVITQLLLEVVFFTITKAGLNPV